MDDEIKYARLKEHVIFEIDTYHHRLNELESEEYPTPVAESIISQLRAEVEALRMRLKELDATLAVDSRGALKRLQSTRDILILILNDYLVWIDGARTRRVPWSIVPGIERIAKHLLRNRKILTSCTPVPNYQISWFRSKPETKWTVLLSQYFILKVPALLRMNALSHVAISHELFHPILEPFIKREKPAALQRIQLACQSLLVPGTVGKPLSQAEQDRRDRLVERTREIWQGAVEEVMCDMGCVGLFGPAGFLALASTAIASPLDHIPAPEHFHPPWRFRLRATLEHCLQYGQDQSPLKRYYAALRDTEDTATLADSLDKELHEFQAITASKSDLDLINNHAPAIFQIAYAEVDQLLERAWKFIAERTKDSPILWTKSIDQVVPLIRMLRIPAPPGEIRGTKEEPGSAPCLSAIANGAWLFQLDQRRLQPDNQGQRHELNFRTTCRLTLKAFENADLRLEYDTTIKPRKTANERS